MADKEKKWQLSECAKDSWFREERLTDLVDILADLDTSVDVLINSLTGSWSDRNSPATIAKEDVDKMISLLIRVRAIFTTLKVKL